MNFNHVIQITFIIIILYLLINNYEKFSDTINITEDDIIREYALDIPATRNLAQIINLAFEKKQDNTYRLYLPIETINFGSSLYIKNCSIEGSLATNGEAGLKFVNKSIQDVELDIFPQYTIIAWYSNTIPKHWKLCNGKSYIKINGVLSDFIQGVHSRLDELKTPDLTDRFIMHEYNDFDISKPFYENKSRWSQNYEFNKTGGKADVILERSHLPLHNHYLPLTIDTDYTHSKKMVSSLDPKSKEYYHVDRSVQVISRHNEPNVSGLTIIDTGESCAPTISNPTGQLSDGWLNENGSYALNVNGTTPHNNIPPYCKLIYIIKL